MQKRATPALFTGANGKKHQQLPALGSLGYTPAVSSKKGLIGIGVPCNRCDASRSSPADHAASLSVPPFMVARTGGRKARRFAQAVPGTPTRSSHRPRLASGAVVFANRTAWRPYMAQSHASTGTSAQIFAHPNLFAPPVQQQWLRGRHPKCITPLWKVRSEKRWAAYKAEVLSVEIDRYQARIAEAEGYARALRFNLAGLFAEQTRGANHV